MRPALNPVLRRELLERFRTRRAMITLSVYLAVLGLLLYALYRIGSAVLSAGFGFGGGPGPTAGPLLGRFLVEGLLFFVLLGVLFVAPGYAAGQIAGERERRTLPLLQVTLLRPSQIVLGKLGASTAWLLLLIVATVPLGATAFFLGGVAVGDLVRGAAFTVVIAVGVAGVAIGFSSLTRRTVGAVVLTYGAVLALTVGTLFGALAEFVVRSTAGHPGRITPIALYANPVFGLADAVRAVPPSQSFMTGELLPSPLALIAEALPRDDRLDRFGVVLDPFDEFGRPVGIEEPFDEPGRVGGSTWLAVGGLYLALGALGIVVATLRTRTTDTAARGWRGGSGGRAPPGQTPEVDAGSPAPGGPDVAGGVPSPPARGGSTGVGTSTSPAPSRSEWEAPP